MGNMEGAGGEGGYEGGRRKEGGGGTKNAYVYIPRHHQEMRVLSERNRRNKREIRKLYHLPI